MKNAFARWMVLAVVLGVALNAAAGNAQLTLYEETTLNGVTLPAGDYQLKWSGEGAQQKVTFIHKGKEITTADARVVEAPSKRLRESVLLRKKDDGKYAVSEVRLRGKKSLVFDEQASAAGN